MPVPRSSHPQLDRASAPRCSRWPVRASLPGKAPHGNSGSNSRAFRLGKQYFDGTHNWKICSVGEDFVQLPFLSCHKFEYSSHALHLVSHIWI